MYWSLKAEHSKVLLVCDKRAHSVSVVIAVSKDKDNA